MQNAGMDQSTQQGFLGHDLIGLDPQPLPNRINLGQFCTLFPHGGPFRFGCLYTTCAYGRLAKDVTQNCDFKAKSFAKLRSDPEFIPAPPRLETRKSRSE